MTVHNKSQQIFCARAGARVRGRNRFADIVFAQSCGVVWCGMVVCGVVWHVVWYGGMACGVVWCRMECRVVGWYGGMLV